MNEQTLWMLIGKALSIGYINPYLDKMYDQSPGFDYYRLAYVLARHMQPNIIVELGTQYGRCTAHFAAGAPKANVVTIDCVDVRKQELFEHDIQVRYPYIDIIRADSVDPLVVDSFADGTIDICFADSLHDVVHVWKEIQTWTPKMRPGAVWLIDDLRECPELFPKLPFREKGIVRGLHTNPLEWPDQEFAYAIVD